MARTYPPDVIVLDTDALLHARFGRGRNRPTLVHAKAYRLGAEVFTAAPVTPRFANPAALTEVLRKLRAETGKWEKVSLLLPDSWFRINIVELPALPDKDDEALDVVRWSLKRTIPVPPEQLRVAYSVLSRSGATATVMILSAMEETISAIEAAFRTAGLNVVLIEPLGINIWNAVALKESDGSTAARLFVYVRDTDFTTAVFRGDRPLFIRSRNIGPERSVEQEIRLSAGYLRDSLAIDLFASCHVAGEGGRAVHETLATEFSTTVRPVNLRDFVESIPPGVQGFDAELTACTGVFTG
jgi:Tfp pilus assembly PilM family ATPase